MADTNFVFEFEGTDLNKLDDYTWTSKDFFVPRQSSFSWARALADFGGLEEYWAYVADRQAAINRNEAKIAANEVLGAIGDAELGVYDVDGDALEDVPPEIEYTGGLSLTFYHYGDGVLLTEREIYNDRPFRLTSGRRARVHKIMLVGNVDVKQVDLATQPHEIARKDVRVPEVEEGQ